MTRQDPQYRAREQYSSYYQGRVSTPPPGGYPPPMGVGRQGSSPPRDGYGQEVAAAQAEFAPPQRSVRPPARTAVSALQGRPQGYPPQRRLKGRPRRSRQVLLAGGGMLALAALVVGPRPLMEQGQEEARGQVVCQETIQSASVLSRAELSQLLAVAERAPKEEVRAVVDEPYCTLPSVEVREGAIAEREAYPLEFNPQTWFIVLYEEGEYAGFDFSFSRD